MATTFNPNILTGAADGDSTSGTTTSGQGNTTGTGATTQNSTTSRVNSNLPGRRIFNPLSRFSSYTYQLSLYMVTPEAYAAFISSGRKNINTVTSTGTSGSYLLAQSGGINSAIENRATPYDYYIDDLKIKHATAGKETLTATNVTAMSFTISEPYGFSFISEMKKAKNALQSSVPNFAEAQNTSRQFFILGIRFFGYDRDGKIVKPVDLPVSENLTSSDPNNGIYERFYDIFITSIKFKIDGKTTNYFCTAIPISIDVGFGNKRARIDPGMNITAKNVEEALTGEKGLLTQLNKFQKDQTPKAREIPNEFEVKFIGNADLIRNAGIVLKSDTDKSKTPMSEVKNSSQVNDAVSVKASPDMTKRIVTFSTSLSIMQAISNIITKSTYMETALKKVAESVNQPDKQTKFPELETYSDNIDAPENLKWYNLNAEVKCIGWDRTVKDWAFKITYIIQPYETPNAITPYSSLNPKAYYGPHKIYNYYFTGENTEVISFEQRFDNLYYLEILQPTQNSGTHGHGADIAGIPGQRPNEDRTNSLLYGSDIQNVYRTSLFDPSGYTNVKMTILGDPDYLIQPSPTSLADVYNQFYGSDGFTINPNGGQVFVEIGFKEPVDYKHDKGLLEINQNILFFNYPSSIAQKLEGRTSYQLITVESNFAKGKFVQNLNMIINLFPNIKDGSANAAQESVRLGEIRDPNAGGTRSDGTQAPAGGATTQNPGGTTNYISDFAPTGSQVPMAAVIEGPTTQQRTSPTGGTNVPPSEVYAASTNIVDTPAGTTGTGTVETTGVTTSEQYAGGTARFNNRVISPTVINRNVADDDGTTSNRNNKTTEPGGRET